MGTNTEDMAPNETLAMGSLLDRVRDRYEAARRGRCPICVGWRLRDDETRDQEGHVPTCCAATRDGVRRVDGRGLLAW